MDRCMEPIEILDWYDGVVVGLVRLSWTEGLFLASLLCWSQQKRRRVLGLLRVDDAEAGKIKHAAAGEWLELVAYLRDLAGRATGDAMVLSTDEESGVITTVTTVPVEEVREHMLSDVERSLEPERQRWLALEE